MDMLFLPGFTVVIIHVPSQMGLNSPNWPAASASFHRPKTCYLAGDFILPRSMNVSGLPLHASPVIDVSWMLLLFI